MRASEHIESDATFLRLFGPGVLDVLPKDNLWDRVQIFRSAPGGGKTTLFRVFTPSVLLTLHGFRGNEDYKELYQRMKDLGAISDSGPLLLGIILSCTRNYATLEDLDFDPSKKERLLYSLINARLILAMLRGALILKKLRYPDDLERLSIEAQSNYDTPMQMPITGSGKEIFDWACSLEKKVCELIDSFGPSSCEVLEGHDTLLSLSLIRPKCILCDGIPIASQVLIMFDDIHKLTIKQRQKLLTTIFDLRPSIGVWIAERFEALSPEELLASGATTGREYEKPTFLEYFWRTGSSSKKFENTVNNIADRRARSARDTQISSFAGCLQDFLDESEWHERFEKVIENISSRVRNKSGSTIRYQEWIKAKEKIEGTPYQRAIEWRILEIMIERDARKQQLTFNFDEALPYEILEHKELSSAARAAAEFLITQEFKIPYYFGMSRIAVLSSSNIEQFLALSGDLFEEIASAELIKRQTSQTALAPERQESILKKAVQQRWDEIPRRIPNGRDVQKFLEAIHQCARWELDKGTASYGAGGGVTGIAITMADRDRLINSKIRVKHPEYERLILTLSTCISHNLLEVSLDRSQGKKGKAWMVLYLNRWLCLHFKLPLQYGGWRPKTLDEICKWLDYGFRPPLKNGGGQI
jgi:hypothetical protein